MGYQFTDGLVLSPSSLVARSYASVPCTRSPSLTVLSSLAVDKTAKLSFVSWLLNQGADPNVACNLDLTDLSVAVRTAPLLVFELLLSRLTPPYRSHFLHHAAERT